MALHKIYKTAANTIMVMEKHECNFYKQTCSRSSRSWQDCERREWIQLENLNQSNFQVPSHPFLLCSSPASKTSPCRGACCACAGQQAQRLKLFDNRNDHEQCCIRSTPLRRACYCESTGTSISVQTPKRYDCLGTSQPTTSSLSIGNKLTLV